MLVRGMADESPPTTLPDVPEASFVDPLNMGLGLLGSYARSKMKERAIAGTPTARLHDPEGARRYWEFREADGALKPQGIDWNVGPRSAGVSYETEVGKGNGVLVRASAGIERTLGGGVTTYGVVEAVVPLGMPGHRCSQCEARPKQTNADLERQRRELGERLAAARAAEAARLTAEADKVPAPRD